MLKALTSSLLHANKVLTISSSLFSTAMYNDVL